MLDGPALTNPAREGILISMDAISLNNLGLAKYAGDVYKRQVSAVYDYLDSGSAAAAYLKTCMLAADHDILYVPDGVPAAKKYRCV